MGLEARVTDWGELWDARWDVVNRERDVEEWQEVGRDLWRLPLLQRDLDVARRRYRRLRRHASRELLAEHDAEWDACVRAGMLTRDDCAD